ncbi:MAG: carboxymuconolactone decarboxylase family protein, partial [Betaproteobacteria bacterium]
MPAKYKELTGVPLSIANRCDPCLAYHIRMAL